MIGARGFQAEWEVGYHIAQRSGRLNPMFRYKIVGFRKIELGGWFL